MKISRRTFFKLIGMTAAGSALPGCERETHNLVPYLLPDDEIVPGVADWYASVCRECEAGCGILVRTREGRAKKIEGNPRHPVNNGKLCARGQAALQGLYNPDRLRGPLRRAGARGDGRFESISWDDGLSTWVDHLARHTGRHALVSRPLHGTLRTLLGGFMATTGGALVEHDPGEADVLRAATAAVFGTSRLPEYDVGRCDLLLSFGAPFLEQWLSPVSFGVAYGHMRQGRPGVRGRFVQIEPRLSLTAANADRWIPVRPGTEGLLALGIGRLVAQARGVPSRDAEAWSAWASLSLEQIARETDVSMDDMRQLARDFAEARAPLAIGGGMAAAHANGTEALTVIQALNRLVGNMNAPGGVRFTPTLAFPGAGQDDGPPQGCRRLWELVQAFREGDRTLLHVYGANPLFSLPPSSGIADLFGHADYIVSFSSYMDESTAMADLVLPDHTPLESWFDYPHRELIAGHALGLGQPVVRPLYETRAVGDVFLQAAQRLGGEVAARYASDSFHSVLKKQWETFLTETEGPSDRPFREEWVRRVQEGGWFVQATARTLSLPSLRMSYEPAAFDGNPDEFPLFFYPYPSSALGHGHGANRPWLQELPDPLTLVVWGSWVEVNPGTAQRLGLRQGDIVRVVSPYGSVEAPLVLFPGLRPDLVSMPIGQGHTAYGRYARNRGVNPLQVVGPERDARTGCPATASTRVRLEATDRKGRLIRADQHPEELITIRSRSAHRT